MKETHGLYVLAIIGLVIAAPLAAEASASTSDAEEVAVLVTNHGTMTFRFFEEEAPKTTAQIKRLIREGFYDGQIFYRVVDGHVIQGGDGGENDQPTVPGEFGAHDHVEGVVGLARDADPDSGTTEIYICLAPRTHLDGSYATFGKLVEGYDVLRRIAKVAVDEYWEGPVALHKPKEPVVIERAYLKRGDADSR